MQGIIKNWLSGKKTYLVMLSGIVGSLVGLAGGDLSLAETVTGILASLGLGSMRAGVAKAEKAAGK